MLIVYRIHKIQKCINLLVLLQLLLSVECQRGNRDIYPLTNPVDPAQPMDPNIPKRSQSDGPRDCAEILEENKAAPSGVYQITPNNCQMCYYNVFCDMNTEGGGWTVISNRFNGSVDFYRGWWFYKYGFGDVHNEYFLGLERINQLTNLKPNELKICLTDVGDMMTVAGYSHFVVHNESTEYAMSVDTFYGDAGDYLSKSNNTAFSTFDHDHDAAAQNCAQYFHSAWWYHTYPENCGSQPNLLGYYFLGRQELPHFAGPGLSWKPVPGPGGPAIKSMVMKIRPMGYLGVSGSTSVVGGGRQRDSKLSTLENNDLPPKDAQKF